MDICTTHTTNMQKFRKKKTKQTINTIFFAIDKPVAFDPH